MFAKWSTKSLKTLLDSCEIQLYHYNQTVFKENELSTHLYLIKHGEIEVFKLFFKRKWKYEIRFLE